jgi:hypothetical protein
MISPLKNQRVANLAENPQTKRLKPATLTRSPLKKHSLQLKQLRPDL